MINYHFVKHLICICLNSILNILFPEAATRSLFRSIVAAHAFHNCSSVALFASSSSCAADCDDSSGCDDSWSSSYRLADDDDFLLPTGGTRHAAVGHFVPLCGVSMVRWDTHFYWYECSQPIKRSTTQRVYIKNTNTMSSCGAKQIRGEVWRSSTRRWSAFQWNIYVDDGLLIGKYCHCGARGQACETEQHALLGCCVSRWWVDLCRGETRRLSNSFSRMFFFNVKRI